MCRMAKTIRYRMIRMILIYPSIKGGVVQALRISPPRHVGVRIRLSCLNLLLCLCSQVLQHLHGIIFLSKRDETMIMVVSADRVHSNSFFGELRADCGHEAHCFEAGVDVESDHLTWKGVFDAVGISRFLSGD